MNKTKTLSLYALSALVAIAALSGCGGSDDPDAPQKHDARILSFTADPEAVQEGEASTLSWQTEHATELRLFAGEDEIPLPPGSVAEGSVEVHPTDTTVYELIAVGATGVEAVAEVTVGLVAPEGPTIAEFVADSDEITFGDSTTLRWAVLDATSIAILVGEEVLHESTQAEGAFEVTPDAQTTYTLVATGEGEVRADVTVSVAPAILRFEADPESVTASPENPAPVTLSWQLQGAESIEIVATPGGPIDVTGLDPNFYDVSVEVTGATVFTLTAHGGGATSTATVEVQAVPPPSITIQAPERVGADETFLLSWEAENASTLRILRNGLVVGGETPPLTGSLEQSIEETSTYLFRVNNAAGVQVEEEIVVEVGPAAILSFEASAPRVAFGETIALSWETVGGSSLVLRDGAGATLFETTDREVIRAGGHAVQAPEAGAQLTFQLTVENGSGFDSRSAVVLVGEGPVIARFEATPEAITLGETVTLSWEATSDASGATPIVTLVDGLGEAIAVEDGANEVEVTPETAGTHSYTLTATTELGAMSATIEVVVAALPSIALTADPEVYDPANHSSITVAWTTADAVALELFVITDDGPGTRVVNSTDPARVAAGTHEVVPTSLPITFRAVATSATGLPVEATVAVDAIPVELNFTATPDTVVGRETVTFSWDATGTIGTYLDSQFVGGTLDPFIDISDDDDAYTFGAAEYDCTGGDVMNRDNDGCVALQFPDGFTFPFAGEDKTSARVYVNGFVSFDMAEHTSTNTSFDLDDVRDQWVGFVHLSPFWNNLNRAGYGGNATGHIHYKLDQDADGRMLIIQWSNFWFHNASVWDYDVDLNFQVILREDGSFDYRYGTMLGTGMYAARALGSEAAIGVRYGTADAIIVYPKNTQVPGGLQNFGFRFAPPELPVSGSIEAVPLETSTYTLHSWDGEVSEDVTVTVDPGP